MESIKPRLRFRDIVGYALAYLGWFATAMGSMVAILLFRNAFNILWAALGPYENTLTEFQWTTLLRPIDRFGLVFGGLVWLGFVIFVEQYYRQSITVKREQRFRVSTDHLYTPPPPPENKFMFYLYRLGLDILARRFVVTFIAPLIVIALSLLLMQIGTWLIT